MSIEDVLSEQGSALPQRALMRVMKRRKTLVGLTSSGDCGHTSSGDNHSSVTQNNSGGGSNHSSVTQNNSGGGDNYSTVTQNNSGGGDNYSSVTQNNG